MMNFISHFLNSRSTFKILLLVNGLLSCLLFYLFRDLVGGDEKHYLSYAQGLEFGRFSQWWFLQNYIPDTVRTPGYPVFLFLVEKISTSIYFIKAIQFLLYVLSVIMVLNVASTYDKGYRLKNIFLLLLLPYVQVTIFTVTIQPEALMTFLLTLYIFIDSKQMRPEWKITFLGLLSGCIFLVRPVFLFFPLIIFLFSLFSKRKTVPIGLGLSMLTIYFLSIMPYGIWNLKNHNVLSLTPIEGAGGVFSLGYWAFKMPGYEEDRYWGNRMSDELFSFTEKKESKKYISAYNKEWDFIDSSCAQYLSPVDKKDLAEMGNYHGYFKTYNTEYTIAREKLLKQLTLDHLKEEPLFAVKTKLFTLIRLWFSGVQLSEFNNTDLNKRFAAIYFSLVSAIFFLASLILIPWALFKKKISWIRSQTVIVLIAYFGIIHMFFALQAKYTIPLRLIVLLLLARTILGLFSHTPVERTNN
jgi:4-amino-4-deoxy-L-arabinose transferase-like glycosyltransferase